MNGVALAAVFSPLFVLAPPAPVAAPLESLDAPSTGIDAEVDERAPEAVGPAAAPPGPPPPSTDSASPAPDAASPAPSSPAPSSGGPSSPAPPAVDERGDPILGYSDVTNEVVDVGFADAPAEEAPLEYADSVPVTYDLTYSDQPNRPPPPPEQFERESTATPQAVEAGSTASPQRFAVEFKMGPYLPAVDRGASGPYDTIFGQVDAETGELVGPAKPHVLPVIGFEWQFVNVGGPLSIGTTVGLFNDRAQALLANPMPGQSPRSDADSVKFRVIPVTLLVGYRFSLLSDRWHIPIVPYARGGIGYGLWSSRDGSGKVSTNNAGEPGRGGSLGWQVNFGGMLRLDFLDRNAARELDQITGINHTYVFGEYQISRLDGFSNGGRMSVGDDTWFLGVAVEI